MRLMRRRVAHAGNASRYGRTASGVCRSRGGGGRAVPRRQYRGIVRDAVSAYSGTIVRVLEYPPWPPSVTRFRRAGKVRVNTALLQMHSRHDG